MVTPTLERPAQKVTVTIEATVKLLAVNGQEAEELVKAALERMRKNDLAAETMVLSFSHYVYASKIT